MGRRSRPSRCQASSGISERRTARHLSWVWKGGRSPWNVSEFLASRRPVPHFGVSRGEFGEPRRTRQRSPHVMAGRSAPFRHPVPGSQPSSIEDAALYRDLTVRQRADRLLGFFVERWPRIGTTFSFTNQEITCAVWHGRNPPTWRRRGSCWVTWRSMAGLRRTNPSGTGTF